MLPSAMPHVRQIHAASTHGRTQRAQHGDGGPVDPVQVINQQQDGDIRRGVLHQGDRRVLDLGGGLDGEGIASRAMAARETAFEIALDKGLTTDLEFLSRRYPGLVAS